jgi:hypothetical protein
MMYGYDSSEGFYERARLPYGADSYSGNARGFYIDDSLYVSSTYYLDVFALSNFERLTTLQLNDASSYFIPLAGKDLVLE